MGPGPHTDALIPPSPPSPPPGPSADPPHGIFLHLVDARVIITNRTDRVNRPWWPLNVEIPVVRPDQSADPVVRLVDSTERRATRTLVVKDVRHENQISGEARQFFWQVLANVIRHVSACPGLFAARRQVPDSHDRITISASLTSVAPNKNEPKLRRTHTYIHTYIHMPKCLPRLATCWCDYRSFFVVCPFKLQPIY